MCDEITIDVARAVDDLMREQRLYELWRPSELKTMTYWIDSTLGRYHHALMRDALNMGTERIEGPLWFVESNPVLQRYRAGVLDARYRSTTGAGSGGPSASAGKPRDGGAPRKMTAEVLAAIPKRGTKQLCVRYLSVDGCKGRGDGIHCSRVNCVHEQPKTINQTIGNYVKTHLGGLHPSITIE